MGETGCSGGILRYVRPPRIALVCGRNFHGLKRSFGSVHSLYTEQFGANQNFEYVLVTGKKLFKDRK